MGPEEKPSSRCSALAIFLARDAWRASPQMGTTTAVAPTTLLVIQKNELLRVFHAEHELFSLLRHSGSHKLLLEVRRGAWWDANKIGMSPPPIETSGGWLMIYQGVRRTLSSSIYRLGLAPFDLQQPEKCLVRGDLWMFAPEAGYERHGD